MKIRYGFVSNSSSASFVVDLSLMRSEKKRKKILKQIQSCPYNDQGGCISDWDRWNIHEEGLQIHGSTGQDNYDFPEYIKKVFKRVIGGKKWEREYDQCVEVQWDG